MTLLLVDWIDLPGGRRFIWGWMTVDADADLIVVRACDAEEPAQISGARAVNLGKLLLRAMWRRHLGLDAGG